MTTHEEEPWLYSQNYHPIEKANEVRIAKISIRSS